MAWVSTHFNSSSWEIEPVNDLGWWSSANSRWESETYFNLDDYVILSELGTWVDSYRPTKIRLTAVGVSSGLPIQNATLNLADSSWDHIGYVSGAYDSGDILDLTFSGNDIKYLLVGLGYEFYITKIEFWNDVEYTPGDFTLNYRKSGETTSIVTYTAAWENALAVRASGVTYYAQCDISTVDIDSWVATDLRARMGGNTYTVFYIGAPSPGDRGVFGGGNDGAVNTIDYITISTPGNATDFGDLTISVGAGLGSCSNGTNDRGIWGGGYSAAVNTNVIGYVTISTPGNATDFGDLTQARRWVSATSNNTSERGVFNGGYVSTDVNNIDYITISTPGNATDFGNLTGSRRSCGSSSNGTNERGVNMGGFTPTHTLVNIIDYITINSAGNATDFGDLASARNATQSVSNLTNDRACLGGGNGPVNTIEYITISTPGNATDFGDLTVARALVAATSNGTNERGVFYGSYIADTDGTIDYITINTTGNATDFGDASVIRSGLAGCSDA